MTRIPLPDQGPNSRGHYLQRPASGAPWTLYDTSGPIRHLSFAEMRMVDAAFAAGVGVNRQWMEESAATLTGAKQALERYARREDDQLDKLLAVSREAAGNPRYGRGFAAGLSCAHALLTGSGDFERLAEAAVAQDRPRMPLDMFVAVLFIGGLVGAGLGAALTLGLMA